MDINWTTIIATILTSGVVGTILVFIYRARSQSSADYLRLIELYKQDNMELRREITDNQKELIELRANMSRLETKLSLMESAHFDLPLPQWLKDLNGNMLALNKAYEEIFLYPLNYTREDYIGRNDKEIWSKGVARIFSEHDLTVIEQKKPIHFTEIIDTREGKVAWDIYKYPRFAGNTVIGVGGIAIKKRKDEVVEEDMA